MSTDWSNLAKIIYQRTYSRSDGGISETWDKTVERVIRGNIEKDPHFLLVDEAENLERLMLARKAMPAGRGLWYSGTEAHRKNGGAALNNCYYFSIDTVKVFSDIQDLLMLGAGVGASVEHRFVSKLPKIKKDVVIQANEAKDADFIVPDSREGWVELTRRVMESFFITGRSFSYSTIIVRGAGEVIKGFGGKASGPLPLIAYIDKVVRLLQSRQSRHLRPIDAGDIICAIGEMVVAGNVRRSAIILLGDPWDKEYLRAKRWDLGPIPNQRANANWSVVAESSEDLHPLFWETYQHGEPFGILNRRNVQKYARMGERKADSAIGVNPCVPGDTEILTDHGYIRIDALLDAPVNVWNGFEWSQVQPRITGHNQPMLKIMLDDGRELRCTTKHKWVIQSGFEQRGEKLRIDADQLKVGDRVLKHDFPVVTGGIDVTTAYTQGFFSAEGSDGYSVFRLYEPKFACITRLDGVVRDQRAKTVNGLNIKTVTLNFTPECKSFVPFNWSVQSRLDWLAGLLDGDATELKEGGSQLGSVDKAFLQQTQKLLSTLGVSSKVRLMHSAGKRMMPDGKGGQAEYECQNCYRLLIGATQIQQLKQLGMRCERLKFNKKPQRDASQFAKVISIESDGMCETVYCFTESKRNLGTFNGIVTGQCAEACLESYENCNLQEIALHRITDQAEFNLAARLMHRWGKRVTLENYHIKETAKVVAKNRRIGTGITGCMAAPQLFNPESLNEAYQAIATENKAYSYDLEINPSIRTTVVKPSGTLSKLMDGPWAAGIHGGFSRYYIQRVRFASSDPLVGILKEAGHPVEYALKFDGTNDYGTSVVSFYESTPAAVPVSDEGHTTWRQLDTLLMAQKYWSDQAVSVTVYYRKEEIPELKDWLAKNLDKIKTISFLCHNDHGFKQAPWEAIDERTYQAESAKIRPIESAGAGDLDLQDCDSGACPIK